jgi:tetratricopeptide (TPR) repeat protein
MWGGNFAQALPWLEQALNPFEQNHNWTEWVVSCALFGVVLAARGDYRGGLAKVEHALTRAKELHLLSSVSLAYSLLANVHLMGGDVQQMLAASHAAVQIGVESSNILPTYSGYATGAWAESRLGQHAAAHASIAQAEAITKKFGGHFLIDDWLTAIKTELAFNEGKIEETLMRAEEAVNLARSLDSHFAEALAQRIWAQALAATNSSPWIEIEKHLARSLSLLEAGDARIEVARTHVVWGKLLQTRGESNAAHEHFEKAAAQFQTSGLSAELVQVQKFLQEAKVAS